MGRFDPKYPPEAIDQLYRLVLDAEPQRTVPQALTEIVESHGVEINKGTAYRHVQRERLRRSTGGDSPLPVDPHEALDLISRQLIAALHAEAQRIIRAGRHGSKPLDVNRARTVARTIRELRAGLEPRSQAERPDPGEPEPDDPPAGNGEPSPLVAELLAAHSATPAPRPSHDEQPERGDAIPSNGEASPDVDPDARARIQ